MMCNTFRHLPVWYMRCSDVLCGVVYVVFPCFPSLLLAVLLFGLFVVMVSSHGFCSLPLLAGGGSCVGSLSPSWLLLLGLSAPCRTGPSLLCLALQFVAGVMRLSLLSPRRCVNCFPVSRFPSVMLVLAYATDRVNMCGSLFCSRAAGLVLCDRAKNFAMPWIICAVRRLGLQWGVMLAFLLSVRHTYRVAYGYGRSICAPVSRLSSATSALADVAGGGYTPPGSPPGFVISAHLSVGGGAGGYYFGQDLCLLGEDSRSYSGAFIAFIVCFLTPACLFFLGLSASWWDGYECSSIPSWLFFLALSASCCTGSSLLCHVMLFDDGGSRLSVSSPWRCVNCVFMFRSLSAMLVLANAPDGVNICSGSLPGFETSAYLLAGGGARGYFTRQVPCPVGMGSRNSVVIFFIVISQASGPGDCRGGFVLSLFHSCCNIIFIGDLRVTLSQASGPGDRRGGIVPSLFHSCCSKFSIGVVSVGWDPGDRMDGGLPGLSDRHCWSFFIGGVRLACGDVWETLVLYFILWCGASHGLLCYRLWAEIGRQLGPAFSSNNAGDGPPPVPYIPAVNDVVYVSFDTFREDEYSIVLPLPRSRYFLHCKYRQLYFRSGKLTRASCEFDALHYYSGTRGVFSLPLSWICLHGSTTVLPPGGILLRRRDFASPLSPASPSPTVNPTFSSEDAVDCHEYVPLDLTLTPTIRCRPLNRKANLGVGCLNLNGYKDFKLPVLGWLANRLGIGVLGVVDLRILPSSFPFIRRNWLQLHPGGDVQLFPGPRNVGGAAFFLDSHWGKRRSRSWTDPSGLGIVNEVIFPSAEGNIRCTLVYWPFFSSNLADDSNGLHCQLQRWLNVHRECQSAEDYIRTLLLARRRKPSSLHLIMGDMNCIAGSSRYDWVASLGFIDAHLTADAALCTHYSGERGTAKIDFLFGSSDPVACGWTSGDDWGPFSDHRPIWAFFPTSPVRRLSSAAGKANTYKRINFTDKAHIEAVQLELRTQLPIIRSSPSSTIRAISAAIVAAFRRPTPANRRQFWSPLMIATSYWVVMLSRFLSRPMSRRAELLQFYTEGADRIGTDGRACWDDLLASHPDLTTLSVAQCVSLRDIAKRSLHGGYRKAEYDRIRAAVAEREGDVRRQYRSLGKPKPMVNLTRLEVDGVIHNDPETIHQLVTDVFSEWLGDSLLGPSHPDLWSSVHDLDALRRVFGHLGVPEEFLVLFQQSLLSTGSTRLHVEADLMSFEAGPTWEQFSLELESASNTSAGGPSGLTYGMLKHSPPELVRSIYDQLCCLWLSRETPAWMKKKILSPIPKASGSLSPNDFRPIMLLEVVRKVWVGAIVRGIREAWERHHILHSAQYGFRTDRSTHLPIVQLINAFEGAFEESTPLYFSSWDIRRAFDSPPRWIIELALRRLGVPASLASYLAYLDTDDSITVSTPWSKSTESASSFSSKKGSGQGDKGSPTFWDAVFDIILVALATVSSSFFTTGFNGVISEAGDTAYADDLMTLHALLSGLQRKADIYSALAIFLNLEIELKKLRLGVLLHPDHLPPPTLVVHLRGWVPHEKEFSTEGFVKYLGAKLSLDLHSSDELEGLRSFLSETAARLAGKSGSAGLHSSYIRGAPLMKVMYAGAFASLTLQEARSLDQPLGKHLKDIGHLAASFPSVLLYAPTELGGLGAPRASDVIFEAQLRLVIRAQRADLLTRHAMEAILARHERHSSLYDSDLRRTQLCSDLQPRYLNGLIDYLSEGGHFLARTLPDSLLRLDMPIRQVSSWSPSHIDVRCLGDFIFVDPVTDCRILLPCSLLDGANMIDPRSLFPVGYDPAQDDPDYRRALEPGQFWLDPDSLEVVQLRGLTPDLLPLYVRRFSFHGRPPRRFRVNGKYRLERGNLEMLSVASADKFTHRCITSVVDGQTLLMYHGLAYGKLSNPYVDPESPDFLPADATMCTDGSFSSHWNGPFSFQCESSSGASVAVIDSDGNLCCNMVAKNWGLPSIGGSFVQESLGLAMGLYLQMESHVSLPIHTDSQSARSYALLAHPARSRRWEHAKETGQLFSIIATLRHRFPIPSTIHWVRGHPERRKDTSSYSIPEIGNAAADELADGRRDGNVVSAGYALNMAARLIPRVFLHNFSGPCLLTHRSEKYAVALSGYYADRSVRYEKIYNHRIIRYVMSLKDPKAGMPTLSQRGARLKLILGRFEKDRLDSVGETSRCPCGCPNHFVNWMTDCQDPVILDKRRLTRSRVLTMAREYSGLAPIVEAYFPDEQFWRGNLPESFVDDITVYFNQRSTVRRVREQVSKFLDSLILFIVNSSLSMQSVARKRADLSDAPSLLLAKRKRSVAERGLIIRKSIRTPAIWSFFPRLTGSASPSFPPAVPSPPPRTPSPPSGMLDSSPVYLDPCHLNIPRLTAHPSLYRDLHSRSSSGSDSSFSPVASVGRSDQRSPIVTRRKRQRPVSPSQRVQQRRGIFSSPQVSSCEDPTEELGFSRLSVQSNNRHVCISSSMCGGGSCSSSSSSSSSGAGAGSWVPSTPPRAGTPARVDSVGLRPPRLFRPGGPVPRVLFPGRRRRPPSGRRLNSESYS